MKDGHRSNEKAQKPVRKYGNPGELCTTPKAKNECQI